MARALQTRSGKRCWQARGLPPFPVVRHDVVLWKDDAPAGIQRKTGLTLFRHERDDGVDGHDTSGPDRQCALERLVAGRTETDQDHVGRVIR